MDFTQAYEQMLEQERKKCIQDPDRKSRLHVLGHAEFKFLELVWWPAFGHFIGLHPEYAVRDFKDGIRYLDFAIFTNGMKVCVEVDGHGPHWRDAGRMQFADHLMRQNHLVIDGWIVIRFSYDDIMERPRRCQQLLHQLFGRRGTVHVSSASEPALCPAELLILKEAIRTHDSISSKYIASKLGIHYQTAAKHLHALVNKGFLVPVNPAGQRIRRFVINSNTADFMEISQVVNS